MLQAGPAQRVTIYIGENHHYRGHNAYMAVFEFLFHHQIAGATVTRGIAGFGADHHIHTSAILAASDSLPIKIEFIESPDKVQEILPKLRDMIGDGMIAMQPTEILQAPAARPATHPAPQPHVRLEGTAKLMRVYFGEKDRWNGKPLHDAIIDALRSRDIAGATVYRGIAGYGAGAQPGHDLPIMVSVVDTEAKIRDFLPLLETMIQGGLVVLSDVEVIKYVHSAPAPGGGGPRS